ncbi:MAG: phosphoglycerate kinase, partial [Nanoarchaeota archaeon]|nr:phosphoglycerate kinase [Nanoarchaeota archaeon]
MKTLKDFNFKGKTVLLRADLNSDVKNGKVLMSERIKEAAKTIDYLKDKKAKIVVIAHQGRPGKTDFLSLKQHAALLNKFAKINFVDDILGKRAEKAIKNLKNSEAILLDNIRFEKDEFNPGKKDNKLLKLTEETDIYVNDSFSVCHRNEASIVLFPKHMKSCAGLLLEKEINALKKIKIKNCLFILGGAK